MAVTIREVAAAAGVSTAAVSKVLHGRGSSIRVGAASSARIREAARNLNYHPNVLARNLRSSRTHTIGIVFENLAGFADGPLYAMYLLDGAAKSLFPRHYRITILPELDHGDVRGSLADGQLDGVIWCKLARDEDTIRLIHECPIPIVALNARPPETPTDAVFIGCDNEGGTGLAVDHLVGLGHRRIAFLCEGEEVTTPDCEARYEAFCARMAGHGLATGEADKLVWSWDLSEFGDWHRNPRQTAIFCWSERAAGVLLSRASEAGVDVPEQLSVVGFDSTPYCETLRPRLTAIRQPIAEMARIAGDSILSILGGAQLAQKWIVVPCELDIRDSTAPPATR
jgi:LacI family transcriptional regulator